MDVRKVRQIIDQARVKLDQALAAVENLDSLTSVTALEDVFVLCKEAVREQAPKKGSR